MARFIPVHPRVIIVCVFNNRYMQVKKRKQKRGKEQKRKKKREQKERGKKEEAEDDSYPTEDTLP